MDRGLAYLRDRGWLDWATVATGFARGWISAADVSEFAVLEILTEEPPSPELAELTTTNLPDPDIRELLDQVLSKRGGADSDQVVRRLMLARLLDLEAQHTSHRLSDEQVMDRLEELYAEFDYPEELRYCSRCGLRPRERRRGAIVESPLRTYRQVIQTLSAELAGD